MTGEVLRHNLRGLRRATIGWIVGVGAFAIVNVVTYPAVRGQTAYDDLLQDMPDALVAAFGIEKAIPLTSPEGYLISQMFGFLLPLLLGMLGIWVGARLVAGEEEAGVLELLLAHPVARRRVALEKFAALVTMVATVAAATWAVMMVTAPLVDLDAGAGSLAVATLASALFAIVIGALAWGLGAAVGRRGVALGVASVVMIASFVIESLAELTDVVANLRWLSPFHFANGNTPMVNGLRPLDVAVLVGLTLIAVVLGTARFERRDVGT